MNNNNVTIAVIVVVATVIVGWFAYNQGYFMGSSDNDQDIEIDLPGGSASPKPRGVY